MPRGALMEVEDAGGTSVSTGITVPDLTRANSLAYGFARVRGKRVILRVSYACVLRDFAGSGLL